MKKTRKTLSVLLSVLLALLMLAPLGAVSFAVGDETPEDEIVTVVETGDCGAEGSDVHYTLYSDGTMVVSGDGAVKEKAFENREDITALWVMDGITEIGKSAFSDCRSMQTLSLADTVKALDDFAFLDCYGLSAVDFGNGLESLGEDSLRGFPLRGPVILPDSLKTIDLQAFEYTNFKTIVFGTELEYADSGALYCTCVNRVAILNGSTVIGENNQGDLTWMNAGYGPTVYSYAGGSVEENAILNDRTFVDLTAIEETDHDWSADVITKLPTCTEPGVKTSVCLNNPTHRKTEEIPKIPHKWVLDSNTEPTCDTAGSRVYSCALCDATHTETLPATGEHTYDDGVITVYPTETTDGEIRYTCTKCGDTYTDTVPATPYQDWLYTESEPIEHKQIGEHVYYTLYADGHASIYGTGDSYTDAEWNDERNTSIFGNANRRNVTSIEIHEGVTGLLMDFACCQCVNMRSLKLPASFVNMTWQTFFFSTGLQTIEVDPANPAWTAADNVLFNKDQTLLFLYANDKPETTYTVPASVETIGRYAFYKVKNLKEVTFPDTLQTIGETAFMECQSLETIHFGNGLETMERGAFYRCYNLKSVALPDSLTVLGDYIFGDEESLTSITLPNGLTSIGEYAIGCCPQVESITIPGSVTSIGSSAFWNWTSLQNVYFTCTQAEWDAIEIGEWNEPLQEANRTYGGHTYDEGVITTPATCGEAGVRTYTCIYCGGTRTETIPATGEHAWDAGIITEEPTTTAAGKKLYTCTACGDTYEESVPAIAAVKTGQIGPDVYYTLYENGHADIYGTGDTYAGFYANHTTFFGFSLPVEITSLEVQPGVTGLLSEFGFSHLLKLQSVKLPASLTSINYAMFHFCLSLESIDVDPENPAYTTVDGVLYNKSVTELVHYPLGKKDKTYTVPAGVKRIEQRSFEAVRNLEEIILPDTLETIGFGAFMGAPNLNTVHLGNGVVTIDDYAFYRVDHVPTITIPGTVKYIGEWAFGYRPYFTDVYYPCPKEAWDKIKFGSENEPLLDATLHFGEHAWDDGVITTPATCGKDGVKTYTCVYCGGTRTEAVPATGAHSYSGVVTTPAGCETAGEKTFTCADCGGSYTEAIPATGHDWSDWFVTRNPSETREGEAYRFCKNDPSHIEQKILEKLPQTNEDNKSFGERVREWVQRIFDRIGEVFHMLFPW